MPTHQSRCMHVADLLLRNINRCACNDLVKGVDSYLAQFASFMSACSYHAVFNQCKCHIRCHGKNNRQYIAPMNLKVSVLVSCSIKRHLWYNGMQMMITCYHPNHFILICYCAEIKLTVVHRCDHNGCGDWYKAHLKQGS